MRAWSDPTVAAPGACQMEQDVMAEHTLLNYTTSFHLLDVLTRQLI